MNHGHDTLKFFVGPISESDSIGRVMAMVRFGDRTYNKRISISSQTLSFPT